MSSERRFAVEFWGVQFAVEWTIPELDEAMWQLMLPNWVNQPELRPEAVFRLTAGENGYPVLDLPVDAPVKINKPDIVDSLERSLQVYLGTHARQAVFVHAGVVGWQGGAIVIPGRSFAGKSTLTLALLEAGASYCSDEYAIVDADGLIHAFPRRLSIRLAGGKNKRIEPLLQGWPIATGHLPLKVVLSGKYEQGATWKPEILSSGEGVLRLLANTPSAHSAPELAIKHLSKAVGTAVCYDSARGEAQETVSLIFRHIL